MEDLMIKGHWKAGCYHESGRIPNTPVLYLQQMGRAKRVPQLPAVQRAQHGDDFWPRILELNQEEKKNV